jgi:hypothetical protein
MGLFGHFAQQQFSGLYVATGHQRHFERAPIISAIPLKADLAPHGAPFGPKSAAPVDPSSYRSNI